MNLNFFQPHLIVQVPWAVVLAMLFFIAVNPSVSSSAASKCEQQFLDFNDSATLLPKLPQPGTAKYKALSKQIRSQLKQTGSYAVLDLSKVFTEIYGRTWNQSLPRNSASQFSKGEILFSENGQYKSQRAFDSQAHAVDVIQSWLQELIQTSIGRKLNPRVANLRASIAEERSAEFADWHLDGGGVSVTLSLRGPGTEVLGGVPLAHLVSRQFRSGSGRHWESVCAGCRAITVPEGHALILLGTDANGALGLSGVTLTPTIHRTPNYSGDRILLVYRY